MANVPLAVASTRGPVRVNSVKVNVSFAYVPATCPLSICSPAIVDGVSVADPFSAFSTTGPTAGIASVTPISAEPFSIESASSRRVVSSAPGSCSKAPANVEVS